MNKHIILIAAVALAACAPEPPQPDLETLEAQARMVRHALHLANIQRGGEAAKKILDGWPKLRLGMSADSAKALVGSPDKINRTVTQGGVHEQWVYRPEIEEGSPVLTRFLYFEGGRLTALQD